jgi:putative PIG3 family NAD(P)H quinone oxidoreductase
LKEPGRGLFFLDQTTKTTMRAIVVTTAGGSEVLQLEERETLSPGRSYIRVRVHASAMNRADVSQRRGTYPPPPGYPTDIPGLEYAGEVDAVGDFVTLWKVGDRVMGIVGGGAHAEFVCVHEREAIAIPADLPFDQAAAIPEAFLTAYDALFNQLEMQVGERLLIHAVGSGVGTAALQLAIIAGLDVIGTSRSADKLTRARELGLEKGVETANEDWPSRVEALSPKGIHGVLDLISGPYVAGNLRVVASRGRIVVVGLTAGAQTPIDLGMVLRKRIKIMGTVLRSRPIEEKIALARDFADRILPRFNDKTLRPVVNSVISFDEIRKAHDMMEGNATFGKIVLTWA